jgi:Rab GDP dissociation inhibitor
VARYGKSPYIYPKWGLGGLPEGFSRLCAVNGGVYMLNKPFKGFEYKDGKCIGVHTLDENGKPALAKAKLGVLTGPTYCQSEDGKAGKEIKQTGQVARWICFMDHPIEGTANAPSAQIIIPGAQVKHKTDMYISFVSYTHQIASKGMYVAVISAKVEATTEEDAKKELMPARKLLGKTREEFFSLNKTYVTAVKDESKLFITDSYDATTHWETSCREIISTYKRMTGKEVDLSIDAAKIDDDPE